MAGKSIRCYFLALMGLAWIVPSVAMAQDAGDAPAASAAVVDFSVLPEPMSFVKAQYAEALKLNALAPGKDRDDKIRAFVKSMVDYDQYAERSMGEKWKSIEAEKQAEFKSLFKELLELSYLKRLSDKSFKEDYKIDWDRVVKTKTSATVSCFTKQKDVETELEIVMHAANGHWEIFDVLVDGASLVKTYQKKYSKKIDERGVDGIIADMKAEIAKLKKA